jgi:hypothetical protein
LNQSFHFLAHLGKFDPPSERFGSHFLSLTALAMEPIGEPLASGGQPHGANIDSQYVFFGALAYVQEVAKRFKGRLLQVFIDIVANYPGTGVPADDVKAIANEISSGGPSIQVIASQQSRQRMANFCNGGRAKSPATQRITPRAPALPA